MSFISYSTHVELRNCRRTLFTIFWLGISYRGDPNRKQSILAQKSQQVIYTMIFYQYNNAVCSKVNKVWQQFLSSIHVEYDMKDTFRNSSIESTLMIWMIYYRCLFEILDGPMKFPIGPTGPIGIAIRDINENLSNLVNFQKLKSNVKVFWIWKFGHTACSDF